MVIWSVLCSIMCIYIHVPVIEADFGQALWFIILLCWCYLALIQNINIYIFGNRIILTHNKIGSTKIYIHVPVIEADFGQALWFIILLCWCYLALIQNINIYIFGNRIILTHNKIGSTKYSRWSNRQWKNMFNMYINNLE